MELALGHLPERRRAYALADLCAIFHTPFAYQLLVLNKGR